MSRAGTSEEDVITWIMEDRQRTAQALYFVLGTFPDAIELAFSVPREAFQLLPGKPGDFDVILVPLEGERRCFERTAAVEVKILRLNEQRPDRNVNSYGTHQAIGALEDGFPFVGILHICVVPRERSGCPDFFAISSAHRHGHRLEGMKVPMCIGYHAYGYERVGRLHMASLNAWRFSTANPNCRKELVSAIQSKWPAIRKSRIDFTPLGPSGRDELG